MLLKKLQEVFEVFRKRDHIDKRFSLETQGPLSALWAIALTNIARHLPRLQSHATSRSLYALCLCCALSWLSQLYAHTVGLAGIGGDPVEAFFGFGGIGWAHPGFDTVEEAVVLVGPSG